MNLIEVTEARELIRAKFESGELSLDKYIADDEVMAAHGLSVAESAFVAVWGGEMNSWMFGQKRAAKNVVQQLRNSGELS